MLGGANTGKSTFLVQLYGRMAARMGRLVTRSAPADLKPISDGLQRLASGIPLEHTRTSADHLMQHLPAATNMVVPSNFPEYAGETLDDLVRSHRIPALATLDRGVRPLFVAWSSLANYRSY